MKTPPKKIGAVDGIYINNRKFDRFDSLSALLHDRHCYSVA